MGNVKCRNCDRSADASAYCGSCAAAIMARALSPSFCGKRKKTGQTEAVRTPRPAAQPRLFRQLALLGVTL